MHEAHRRCKRGVNVGLQAMTDSWMMPAGRLVCNQNPCPEVEALTAEPVTAAQFGCTVTQQHTHPGLIWGSEVAGEPFSPNRYLSPLVLEVGSL